MNEFTKVFAKTIEDEAIKQIETLSNSEAYNSCKIRIMPDWMHDCVEWGDCNILFEKIEQKNK